MGKHYKKSIVYPEKAREWLSRYESGEALKAIALKDHFDIRTVKRQVEEAISDRDIKAVRQTVLRSALEQHFNDFVELAEKIRNMANGGHLINLDPNERSLLDGLKQHLPRSPFWDYLDKYQNNLQKLAELKKNIKDRIENIYIVYPEKKGKIVLNPDFTMPRLVHFGSNIDFTINISTAPNIKNKANQIASTVMKTHTAKVNQIEPATRETQAVKVDQIEPATRETQAIIEDSYLFDDLREALEQYQKTILLPTDPLDLKRLQQQLNGELTTILLRRVVPGRCRYCPI
jgi:hypothetical protein